jgi:hypothetical protein
MIYRGTGFLAVVWLRLLPRPFFPLPPVSDTQKDWERETTFWWEGVGKGGGEGDNSCDGEKAWFTIKHSILSGCKWKHTGCRNEAGLGAKYLRKCESRTVGIQRTKKILRCGQCTLYSRYTVLTSVADPDPDSDLHHLGNMDSDPHRSKS